MATTWSLRERSSLTADEMGAMYRIHESLYANVDRATFLRDLTDKDQVLLVSDDAGEIRGYTTLALYRDTWGWVLFSGDTGVDRSAWGGHALQTGWLAAAMAAHDRHGPLDWLLLAGGSRTYRYLPLFFRRFWPNPSALTPPDVQVRLDARATERFGAAYTHGIARLGVGGLRAEHDVIRPDDPVDRFYRARNPGFDQGDELVCLTEISPANLTEAGQRILRRLSR
ncbi:MAG: hypothetical protein ABMA64_08805 [Myxococcota bacterium]